ncbi:MAG: right-handed parallel beta-helix repeat-containing protein [Candidatus Hodarchaeales archaeon]
MNRQDEKIRMLYSRKKGARSWLAIIILVNATLFITNQYEMTTGETGDRETATGWSTRDNEKLLVPDLVTSYVSLSYFENHEPITITNDVELAIVAKSGSGTESDPYILEGWYITGYETSGIFIVSTTKYFIIRDCWINGGSEYSSNGITIENTAAGTVKIINNTCQNNGNRGINILYSANSTVANNTCKNNSGIGINILYSANSTVANNTCKDNGDSGIYISRSTSSIVTNNIFQGDGLYINPSINRGLHIVDDLLSYSIVNNKVNGLPLGFLTNEYNLTVTISYGQLIMVNCTDVVVKDQNISNTTTGITLRYCSRIQLINNTSQNNEDNDISIYHSDYSFVTNNTCQNNRDGGILIDNSPNSLVTNNTCQNNRDGGILIDNSPNSLVTNNTCQNNEGSGIYIWNSYNSILTNNTCQKMKGVVSQSIQLIPS